MNGVEIPEVMKEKLMLNCHQENLQTQNSKSSTTAVESAPAPTVMDLFRHSNLRVKTLVLAFTWMVCSALYYVLLLDQSELSSDPYLGFVMTALVQLPGYVYVIFTLERPTFGRKRSMCAFLILSGICLVIHPLIKNDTTSTASTEDSKIDISLSVIISILGRFCANCSYTILNLFSAEQFPTVIRGVG